MAMIESRNQTSHSYNEVAADKIAQAALITYLPQFRSLAGKLEKLAREE